MFNLSGRTAVVIGGTSGIGLSLARAIARAGADVVPTGRREALVQSAAGEIRGLGRRSFAAVTDVTQAPSLQALLDAVVAEFSKVDILVNCAGRTARSNGESVRRGVECPFLIPI